MVCSQKLMLALTLPFLSGSWLMQAEAASDVKAESFPCEHSKVTAAYQHKVVSQSTFAASGGNTLSGDISGRQQIMKVHTCCEDRSDHHKSNDHEGHIFARDVVTEFATKGDVGVITVTVANTPYGNGVGHNLAATPTSDTDSGEENSDDDDGSGSESDEDQKNSIAGGTMDDDTDLEECLDHYRDPANITALVFTASTMDGSSVDSGSVTTIYNVSNHWGVSYEHPNVEMRIFRAKSCPPNATMNLWNIKFDKKEAKPAEAASAHLPSCTELISPEVKCTDEMSCRTRCALHVHHHNYLLIGLLSALGGMALTSLLGFAIGYCLRRRHRRRAHEKVVPAIPAVIIDSTPPNADGNVDIELEPARRVVPGSQSPTAPSSLPQRIRRHVSTPLSLSHRKGLFSYFNVGNSSTPPNNDQERNGDEDTYQESSKSETLANGNEESTSRDAPRLVVF